MKTWREAHEAYRELLDAAEADGLFAAAERRGYERAVANLRDADRFALWVAAQPFDQDLANDEPSRQQLADYLDATKETTL